MKKFDLTVFEIGLKKGVFDQIQLMNLIYGEVNLAKEMDNILFLEWNVARFNEFPIRLREQLIRLLISYTPEEARMFKSVHDVANELALCALESTVSPQVYQAAKGNLCHTAIFGCTSPAVVVREIRYWVEWGIEIEDVVLKMAKLVLDEFLKDAPQCADMGARVQAKKRELVKRKDGLNSRILALMRKYYAFGTKILATKSLSEQIAMQIKLYKIMEEFDKSVGTCANVYRQLGQAEVYPLIKVCGKL